MAALPFTFILLDGDPSIELESSMYRACLALALAFVFTASSWAQKADDKKPAEPTRTPAEKKLLENPNDSQAWNAYMGEVITTINRPTTDTAAALRKVDAAEAFMAE